MYAIAAAVIRKLEALLGDSVVRRLTFSRLSRLETADARRLHSMVLFLVENLDSRTSPFHHLALAEFEQALIVCFLCTHHHNLSHRLDPNPPRAAPWQVRRAEEYISRPIGTSR